ncbi:TPA: DUF551 domain-containing protein [Escherichia coli]|nr:DUF551 domain-containing protein [Escherichia coli]
MTTFTDKELIKEIKERIGSLDVRDNIERRAYEIALASLEAEPVAYIFKHPAGKLFWSLTDESNKEQADVIPVYAAAPASVVPDNASEPLAYAYKELTPEIMRNHLAVFERYGIAPNDSSTTIQALRIALASLEAEPVNQTYKSPQTQFKQVADLYEMQFDDGRTCTFHTDAQKAVQWLQACDGNRVQEYVKLERLQNALSGNSPVTPDGWISCSERMPKETGDIIVVSDGIVMSGISYSRRDGFYIAALEYDDDEPIGGVTHWMPLPEPPQEVNRD